VRISLLPYYYSYCIHSCTIRVHSVYFIPVRVLIQLVYFIPVRVHFVFTAMYLVYRDLSCTPGNILRIKNRSVYIE